MAPRDMPNMNISDRFTCVDYAILRKEMENDLIWSQVNETSATGTPTGTDDAAALVTVSSDLDGVIVEWVAHMFDFSIIDSYLFHLCREEVSITFFS